ncbi:protein of unknown function [Denitratisoma oestradiolicum]|uniref:Uncharacterized protein n=2 Tax=Denitratisoma oestradiolicum TaxID=311182 RepID=A0A6S6XVS6_9PROT|nr:protein of unknown function [Denitratisoma oestradiolicum]
MEKGVLLKGHRRLYLYRDGVLVLDWPLDGDVITAGPYAGQNVRTMMAWVESSTHDLDEVEAIAIARRTLIVSISLLFDMDKLPPSFTTSARAGACYSYQPALIPTLTRAHGSSRDFSSRPDALLSDLK